MWNLIGVAELHKMLEERRPLFLLDLRDPEDYLAGHIPGAVCAAAAEPEKLPADPPGALVILICYRGSGSIRAAQKLSALGFRASAVSGGMEAWNQAGYAAVRG